MIRQSATRRRTVKPRALGPRDEGRVLTERQYLRCTDAPGYVSEIFDGAVHMSPSARPWHDLWRNLIREHLEMHRLRHSDQFNFVTGDNDVVVPFRTGPTRPRPDIAAYHGFPSRAELDVNADWAEFCPVLVVEIVSPRRRRKDVERNRDLYWAAGGISEYWIVDPSKEARCPDLIVHTRTLGRRSWTVRSFSYGQTFKSDFFDGLQVNLRQIFEQP